MYCVVLSLSLSLSLSHTHTHTHTQHTHAHTHTHSLSLSKYQAVVAFSRNKYQVALEHFVKAIQEHPACGAEVRVAIASCCFKLEQYDRARAAIETAISLDVSFYCKEFINIKNLQI